MDRPAFASCAACMCQQGAPDAGLCKVESRNRRRVLAAGALLVSRAVLPAVAEPAPETAADGPPAEAAVEEPTTVDSFVKSESGLEVRDYRVGSGRPVVVGDAVTLKWTGRLADRFGWSFQREDADFVTLKLSGGEDVIAGFTEGVLGNGTSIPPMREGGKRRLVIPKELGYTREGQLPLPSDFGDRRRLYSTVLNPRRYSRAGGLVIDVELRKKR